MEEILMQAKKLGEMLAASDETRRVAAAEEKQSADEKAQKLIQDYNQFRESLMAKIRDEKPSNEELKGYQEELAKRFEEVSAYPVIAEYLVARQNYEAMIQQVMNLVSGAGESSCGGSCSSCSGCH